MTNDSIPQPIKRAILYARVSGDDRGREGRGLQGQLDLCREYAHAQGFVIVAELPEDEKGVSGASWDAPQLNRAITMASQGEFDILICQEMDRLARSLAKQLVVESEFERLGVTIAYVLGNYEDTLERALTKNVRAVISEYERLKIVERLQRGRRLKAESGKVVLHGGAPYGYRAENRNLAIHEQEAAIVRLIFDLYVASNPLMGMRAIARELTKRCIPTATDKIPRGRGMQKAYGKWGMSTITRMLSNETYVGRWRYTKDDNIVVPVPPIVAKETFELAAARRQMNRNLGGRVTHEYLFRQRVRCGECGVAMAACTATTKAGHIIGYYRCPCGNNPNHFARSCTQRKHFRSDKVDAAAWKWLEDVLMDPEKIRVGFAAMRAEEEVVTAPLRDRMMVLERLIKEDEAKEARLLDLYLAGDFDKTILNARKGEIQARLASLRREKSELESMMQINRMDEATEANIIDAASRLSHGLDRAALDFEQKRALILDCDMHIILGVKHGELTWTPRACFANASTSIM